MVAHLHRRLFARRTVAHRREYVVAVVRRPLHRVRAGTVADALRVYHVRSSPPDWAWCISAIRPRRRSARAARSSASSARSLRLGSSSEARDGARARQRRHPRHQPDHHVYGPGHLAGRRTSPAFSPASSLTFAIYVPPRRVAPVVVDATTGRALRNRVRSAQRSSPHAVTETLERDLRDPTDRSRERCPASNRAPGSCRWRSSSSAASRKACTRSSKREQASESR